MKALSIVVFVVGVLVLSSTVVLAKPVLLASTLLAVRVYQDGDAAVPDVYPLLDPKGIVTTGDNSDPDFETIITKLRDASRHWSQVKQIYDKKGRREPPLLLLG